jgi:CTP synthase (UTP-ammonia lyase)
VPTEPQPLIALVGDRGNHNEPAHPKIEELLADLGVPFRWMPTVELVSMDQLSEFHAIWVVPGAPYHNQPGVHRAIRYARENAVPYLGTCGGFFSTLIEYADNVVRHPLAVGVDDDPRRMLELVAPLACSLNGETKPLTVTEGSRIAALYGGTSGVEEVFHCQYTLSGSFMEETAAAGELAITARDAEGAPRALEIARLPFFVGALFQPELASTGQRVHPVVAGFLAAARQAVTPAPAPR